MKKNDNSLLISSSNNLTTGLPNPNISNRDLLTPKSRSDSGKSTPIFSWSPLSIKKPIVFTPEPDKFPPALSTDATDLYPNCDASVWLRSCDEEIITPLNGKVAGIIPKWLNGSLLRNGPGSLKVGDMSFQHLFDSSALLHRFAIEDGKVTYQCRFLKSNTFKRNNAARRIIVTEFGTSAVPDPCQTIFNRIATLFKPGEINSDNAMISVYPFGDEMYAFTESPVIHKFDSETLETEIRLNVSEYVGIVNHTSHPHVMSDGTVYNLGMSITKTGPAYNIVCFPPKQEDKSMFDLAHIVATIPARWPLHPSYMHTFGITENYFIIVEQPLSVSVANMVKNKLKNEPFIGCLRWYQDEQTQIYVLNRESGELECVFNAEAFFFLHIINQYEIDNHIVLDICCYRDPAMLQCMYVENMKNMQTNPDYAKMFRGRPLRFVLPLKASFSEKNTNPNCAENELGENLVKIPNTMAQAYEVSKGKIYVKPELLCNLGCETPRIYYEEYLGRKYQFFYAISSDVDATNPGTIIKIDVSKKTRITWCEENCYPSEPIFVPSPDPQSEDDGVVLAALVWGREQYNKVGLIVLEGKTLKELGRAEFETSGPVPKCLHGWFINQSDTFSDAVSNSSTP